MVGLKERRALPARVDVNHVPPGMFRDEFRHVVRAIVDDDPTIVRAIVFRDVISGERFFVRIVVFRLIV